MIAIDVKVYQPNSERFFPYTAWSNCALSLQILGLISIKCKKEKEKKGESCTHTDKHLKRNFVLGAIYIIWAVLNGHVSLSQWAPHLKAPHVTYRFWAKPLTNKIIPFARPNSSFHVEQDCDTIRITEITKQSRVSPRINFYSMVDGLYIGILLKPKLQSWQETIDNQKIRIA